MLYFDFTSSLSIVNGEMKYSGGTNYAIAIIKNILSSIDVNHKEITIVLPKGATEETRSVLGISEIQGISYLYTNSLEKVDFIKNSKLFIPQVNGQTLLLIPKIKKRNLDLKIFATLHDRQHNYYRFDWYDRYYYTGLQRTGIVEWFTYYLKRIVFSLNYTRCVKEIDEIFTVSNYSMQMLMNKKVKNINFYLQKSLFKEIKEESNRGDYILFVSGGRPEKNLLRTLEAFSLFKQETKSRTKMIVTGVSDYTKSNLINSKKFTSLVEEKDYQILGYVSYEQLAKLYAGCKYVAFTSKGEGYGLPIREALSYGKTVLASRTTSVPEVAGAILYYIDPFNVDSIKEGFAYLDDEEVLNKYESFIEKKLNCIEQMVDIDNEMLIDRLLK